MRSIQEIIDQTCSSIAEANKKNRRKRYSCTRDEVVFQHNNLVEANYRLSLQEKRIVLWLLAKIQPTDEDFKKHRIKASDLCDLIGSELNYQRLHKILKALMGKTLSIYRIDEESLTTVHWIDFTKCWFKEGILELSFHPEMKPFLLALKQRFTAIKLSDLMQFSSMYAIRIYELLKQYESLHERILSVQDIRDHCGISKEKFERYSQFKEKVIVAAQKEINSKSDIKFEFEEEKTGRRITAIRFLIRKNKAYQRQLDSEAVRQPSNQERKADAAKEREAYLIRGMNKLEFSYSMIRKFLSKYEGQYNILIDALRAVQVQVERGHTIKPKAMFRAAVEGKWSPDYFLPRPNK